MRQQYFHSTVEGYRVKYKHDPNFTNFSAYIEGLGRRVYADRFPEITRKVREVIAENPKVRLDKAV